MDKITLQGMDQNIYIEKLFNGLQVVLIPFNNKKEYYISYTTKYGSIDLNFIPDGEKKEYNSPLGIAHFLEHKVFEQEDSEDPFSFFSKSGTNCNAGTSFNKTTYFIYGINNIEQNLDYLINFVNKPYFTDENVEKEKGIIIEEIKMYSDNPDWILSEELQKNTFINHPLRYDIAGYEDTVKIITKEDLYTCYENFYNPNNMILIVSGNFDKDKIMDLIKRNEVLSKKQLKQIPTVLKKEEPIKVCSVYKEIESSNTAYDKACINFKISLKDVKDKFLYSLYLSFLMSLVFGNSSTFKEDMFKLNYCSYSACNKMIIDDLLVIEFYFELLSSSADKLLEEVKNRFKNKKITKEEFKRYSKVLIASTVFSSDSPQTVSESVLSEYINYGKIYPDKIDIIRNLDYDDFERFRKNLDISNHSMIVMKKKR